jgi:hypothetical protein
MISSITALAMMTLSLAAGEIEEIEIRSSAA